MRAIFDVLQSVPFFLFRRSNCLLAARAMGGRIVHCSMHYTPFTRSSKHRAIIEQTSSKCIQNTRAQRVL